MPVALRAASVGRMTSPVRVVMAEDSPLLRAGLAKLLSAEDAVELLAVAADLDELLAAVEQHRPDVVLSDVRMPPTGTDEGVRAAELLRASHPGIGVLLLSQYDEPSCARRLLEAGASGRGYLLKDRVAEPAQLAAALRTVAEGGSVVDPVVVDGLLRRRDEAQEMTTVQRRVLLELAKGHDERAVASLLGMSPAAVAAEVVGLTGLLGVPAVSGVGAASALLSELLAVPAFGGRLATVLFTDIVRSTEVLAQMGDVAYEQLLRQHDALTSEHVLRRGGSVTSRAGDGMLALFPSAAAAVAAAHAMVEQVAQLGLQLRVGLHAGEVQVDRSGASGIAIHVGARVLEACDPGQVLLTSTVADLLAGSSLTVVERARRTLRGVPGEWRLLEAVAGPQKGAARAV
jgi:DNA-binding NarL/FixJ family response regulator/class 3 adenylate cyclase